MGLEPRNIKKGRVITSPDLALGADCGASCTEVNGRGMEKNIQTQHIYDI